MTIFHSSFFPQEINTMAVHAINRADWKFLDSKVERFQIPNTGKTLEVILQKL